MQCTACATVECGLLITVARKGRIENTEGVESRLGRCQDVTRRMMRTSMVTGNFGRDER